MSYIYNATAFVGRNGTGKTTKILQLIEKTTFKRVVIFNFSAESAYNIDGFTQINSLDELVNLPQTGKFVYTVNTREAMQKPAKTGKNAGISFKNLVFLTVIESLNNSLIVFDDVRAFTNKNTTAAFKSVFVGFRQRKQNIITTYHSLQDIQIDIYPHFSYMFLFNTGNRDAGLKEHKQIQEAKEIISKECEKNPYFHLILDLR